MIEDSIRISANEIQIYFEILDTKELVFGGFSGGMYESVLRKIRNSGINITVNQEESFEESMTHLTENKTDIVIPFRQPLFDLNYSSQYVDWGGLFYTIENNIISGGKIGVKYGPFRIIEIFQTKVWICIFSYIIFASIILAVSNIIRVSQFRKKPTINELFNSTLIIMSLLFNQGIDLRLFRNSYSQRILRNTCIFASTTIFYFTTCNLLTSLSSAEKPNYINSLQDLISKPQIKIFMSEYSLIYKIYNKSDVPLEKAALEQSIRTGGLFESAMDIIEEAAESIQKGTGVFLFYKSVVLKNMDIVLELMNQDYINDTFLHISEQPVQIEWFSIPSRKGFNKTLKEIFYRSVSWYVESGIFHQNFASGQNFGIKTVENAHARNRQRINGMAMINMILPLIILACGCLLATTQLQRWPKFRRRNSSQNIRKRQILRLQNRGLISRSV